MSRKTVQYNLRLSESIKNSINALAEKERRSINTVINMALELYLSTKDKEVGNEHTNNPNI